MSGLTPVAADVVRVVVGLGTVVVLPLGLRLLGDRAVPRSRSMLWPTVGVLAAVSVWLPVGAFAALLAVPFALAGVVLAACALRVRGFSTAVALATPLVGCPRARRGAGGLGAARVLRGLPGADGAAHAVRGVRCVPGGGARGDATDGSRVARTAAVAAPTGVLLVLAGYFVSDAAELVGAVVLTVGLWCAAAADRGARRVAPCPGAPAGRCGDHRRLDAPGALVGGRRGDRAGAPEPVVDGRDARGRQRARLRPVHAARPAAPAEDSRADRADVRGGRRHAGGTAPGRLPAPAGAAPADAGRDGTRPRSGRRRAAALAGARGGPRRGVPGRSGGRPRSAGRESSRGRAGVPVRAVRGGLGRTQRGPGRASATARCRVTCSVARRPSPSSATTRGTCGSS